jgi:hypothetical protein
MPLYFCFLGQGKIPVEPGAPPAIKAGKSEAMQGAPPGPGKAHKRARTGRVPWNRRLEPIA